jgi:hypothetical protein
MPDEFPEQTMRELAKKVARFSAEWKGENKSPHPDFGEYMVNGEKGTTRTRRVMRRLRKFAAREYEVCYRICVLSEPVEFTTEWLNERAQRNDIAFPSYRPEGPHYTRKDTIALLMAGLEFAEENW